MFHFEERFAQLNERQKKAVEAIEGPVLVIAGPGSGKTEILSLRVANILKKTDTHPSSILCLTFTDSAAANMRERLAGLIGGDAYRVVISTFHSFSTDIIGSRPEYFYHSAAFSTADELTQMEILEEIFKELPWNNPLRTAHPAQGFTYLGATKKAIACLKKAGITPENFHTTLKSNAAALKKINELMGVFDARLSIKEISAIRECIKNLPKSDFGGLGKAIARSLEEAVSMAEETETAAPLSAWKAQWVKKNDIGERVFKDSLYQDKLAALADAYKEYLVRMHARGYYDFDDMLLDVLAALGAHPALKYELQEQYQYILVDEFQDTNDAQMKLLSFLTDAPVHEGRPNIMAVGDDDQAIYKFQGADISNIFAFQKQFKEPEIITLTGNYRSHQDILDLARYIILKGTERLERRIKGLSKDLTAAGVKKKESAIVSRVFPSSAHERHWIAKEIARLIAKGKNPNEIAVIGRRHKDLQELLPHLAVQHIPVAYERQRNVLQEPHIRQIIRITQFVSSLARKNRAEADEYLPEILSFPFWGLDRKTVWELSSLAAAEHASWLELMIRHKDARVRDIALFFLDLGMRAQYEPAEYVLDDIIGPSEPDIKSGRAMQSPFRRYYFSKEKFMREKASYLSFLSGLHVFVQALREYKRGRFLKIDDMTAFADLHEKNNMPLTDQSYFMASENAIHLLSAHKAKGMEFDTVFVLSCQDAVWAGGSGGSLLPFPLNMPIAPAGDTTDDQLRIFYVALTRAKYNLYLTSFEKSETGKNSPRLRFLAHAAADSKTASKIKESVQHALTPQAAHEEPAGEPANILSADQNFHRRGPYCADEKTLLGALVKDYQMSVTHLDNFLNVREGGPQMFLEKNLLRFPQAKSASGSYGSAMHKAIELLHLNFKKEGILPQSERLARWFESALKKERLSETDFIAYLAQGTAALAQWYDQKKGLISLSDRVEVNFKNQGVLVDGAHLTGKLDKIIFKEDTREIEVRDFKTGKIADEWEGEGVYEKIKLYRYKRQLMFYKLLIEHSREFSGKYTVKRGVLEFLEPYRGKIIDLPLEISAEETKRTRALIAAVWKKILSLDFPDITKYSSDLAGIIAFENDLLNG